MQMIKQLFKDQQGASVIEYGLIAALIAVALVVMLDETPEDTSITDMPPAEQSLGN